MPTICMKPFNQAQKNDFNNAETIAGTAPRPKPRRVSAQTGSGRPAVPSHSARHAQHGDDQPDALLRLRVALSVQICGLCGSHSKRYWIGVTAREPMNRPDRYERLAKSC